MRTASKSQARTIRQLRASLPSQRSKSWVLLPADPLDNYLATLGIIPFRCVIQRKRHQNELRAVRQFHISRIMTSLTRPSALDHNSDPLVAQGRIGVTAPEYWMRKGRAIGCILRPESGFASSSSVTILGLTL